MSQSVTYMYYQSICYLLQIQEAEKETNKQKKNKPRNKKIMWSQVPQKFIQPVC